MNFLKPLFKSINEKFINKAADWIFDFLKLSIIPTIPALYLALINWLKETIIAHPLMLYTITLIPAFLFGLSFYLFIKVKLENRKLKTQLLKKPLFIKHPGGFFLDELFNVYCPNHTKKLLMFQTYSKEHQVWLYVCTKCDGSIQKGAIVSFKEKYLKEHPDHPNLF